MHYRIQLNAYRYILEKYYDKRVISMHVVCTHPDNVDAAFVDDVPDMSTEIESMMDIQRSRVRETLSLSRFDYRSLDPLGGMDEDDDFSFNERIDMETARAGDSQILRDLDSAFEHPPEYAASGVGSGSTPIAPATAQSVRVVTFGGSSSSGMPPLAEPAPDTPVPVGEVCISEPGAIGSIAHMNGDDELRSLAPGSAVADHIKKRRLLPGAASFDFDFLKMFQNYDTSAIADLSNVTANVAFQKASIVHRTKELHRMFTEAHSGWPSYLQQLAVGALSMYSFAARRHVYAGASVAVVGDRRRRLHSGPRW
jgi:hypothetical protein